MFGNRLGWGVAAVLAIGVFGLVYLLGSLNTISQPSRGVVAGRGPGGKPVALDLLQNPQLLEPIVLPFRPVDIVPEMTQAEDAGPLYREAIAIYKANKYDYDLTLIMKGGKPRYTDLEKFPALEPLIKARYMTRMTLYKGSPGDVINLKSEPENLKALNELGTLAHKLGFYIKGDPGKGELAKQLAEAAFSLGVKMAEERLRYTEWTWGAAMLRDSALALGSIDPSRNPAATKLNQDMRELISKKTDPLWHVIGSVDQSVIGLTAGDVFYIVKNSKEPLWRIEGLLKLGRYKYNAGGDPNNANVPTARGADMRQAKAWVKRIRNTATEDPAIRAAAAVADDMTYDDYQRIGS